MQLDEYQQTIRALSDRIVTAQTPVRVLDAVKWDDNVRQGFFAAGGRELPKVDRAYYEGRPLAFDSSAKKEEFQNIERDITRQLGQFNPVGQIMRRMCKEYRMVIPFASYPTRLRKLTNRTRAIHMAEEGADFLDVFAFFREQDYTEDECYSNANRVFRGSLPNGLPFTKDLSYLKGFIMIYNYIQLAVRKGKLEQIPLLFCGKTTLEDMRTLRQLVDEGMVVPPRYLPQQFQDLNALSAWMCFSNFLNHLSLDRIEADYANIL